MPPFKRRLIQISLLFLSMPVWVMADHPIEVQRKSARGEHFEALVLYDRLAQRNMTPDARLAAAKSAWALGLVDKAVAEFDHLIVQDELTTYEQGRIHLMRSILEYQEQRYQVSTLYAERAVKALSAGTLRGKAWLVWGDSLQELGKNGDAQEKYTKAIEELVVDERPEAYYRMGLNLLRLGKSTEAQAAFENVPLGHARTPSTIRELARIALDNEEFDNAAFWLARGRSDYPDHFLDSWVDYALIRIGQEQGELKKVREMQKQVQEKYPPSDSWLTLLLASSEVFEWKTFFGKEILNDRQ